MNKPVKTGIVDNTLKLSKCKEVHKVLDLYPQQEFNYTRLGCRCFTTFSTRPNTAILTQQYNTVMGKKLNARMIELLLAQELGLSGVTIGSVHLLLVKSQQHRSVDATTISQLSVEGGFPTPVSGRNLLVLEERKGGGFDTWRSTGGQGWFREKVSADYVVQPSDSVFVRHVVPVPVTAGKRGVFSFAGRKLRSFFPSTNESAGPFAFAASSMATAAH